MLGICTCILGVTFACQVCLAPFFLVDAPSFGPAAATPDGPAPTALYVLYPCTSTYMCNLRVSYLNFEPYHFVLLRYGLHTMLVCKWTVCSTIALRG